MKINTRRTLVAIAALGIGVLAASAVSNWRWSQETQSARARLYATSLNPSPHVFSPEQLEGLPAPVVRYFKFALTPGQEIYHRGWIRQSGTFRAGGLESSWSPFTADQAFAANSPGFIWDASIRMSPLAPVRVRDSYLEGEGATLARMGGLLTLANVKGTPEAAAGALQRWLAEAVWCPTLLLPSETLAWEPIDENQARAIVTDTAHGVLVSLEFTFGEHGEIVRCYTPSRYRDKSPTPWEGTYRNYVSRNGMMVPQDSEVAWILPEGRLEYCRVHLDEIHFGEGK